MIKEIGTYTIPAWAVPYLEYGQMDGLEHDENESVDWFMTELEKEGFTAFSFEYAHEQEFSHQPEFGLPCECYETRVFGHKIQAA